jgi:sugar/nucleoside kinase (ribokinase family)
MKSNIYDAVVIGELNIDLVLLDVPFPEYEKEQLAKDMRFTMGSSSAITAHNLSMLGAQVGFIGKAGSDYFGTYMVDRLGESGVDTGGITDDNNLKTGATIVLSNQGRKALLTYLGAMVDLTADDIDWDYVKRYRHLHLGCYYLQSGIRSQVPSIFAKAQRLGLSTSLDTNWDPEELWDEEIFEALEYTNIFLPNDAEAKCITHTNDLDEAIQKLNSYVDVLVVKCGQEGSFMSLEGKIYKHQGFLINAVESTGAGDSFNAGFLYEYLKGNDWYECLRFGNACGALAVTEAGGTDAFRYSTDLHTRIHQIMKNERQAVL